MEFSFGAGGWRGGEGDLFLMSALCMSYVYPNRGSMTFDLAIADEPDGANLGQGLDCDAGDLEAPSFCVQGLCRVGEAVERNVGERTV
jgi:hypothetical protein